ncbi:MAG TPA: hemerythrin family protein [Candidatus Limnocylindrales bacterium]
MTGNAGLHGRLAPENIVPTIVWDQSMTTGVDSVDDQHKQLIAWLNDLLVAMSQGRGRLELQDLLDQLGNYAVTHFGHEEGCMAKYQCPIAPKNVAQHKEFIVTFASFREEFEHDGAPAHLVVRIETELMRWLSGHIKRTDTLMAPCVKGKG